MMIDLDRHRFERQIVRLHKTGEYTGRRLAKEIGIPHTSIRRILRKHGVLSRLHYRNEAIWRLHKAGVSLTDLVSRFGVQRHHIRDHILTQVSFKAPIDPFALINVERVCTFCGKVFRSRKRDQTLCSKRCVTDWRFVHKCAVYIEIRQMLRTGSSYKDLAKKYKVTTQRITVICNNDGEKNPWAEKLIAIEVLRRHKGHSWLSGLAKIEKRTAAEMLKAAHMLKPLRQLGII